MKLCSACLLGINCKYDGKSRADERVIKLLKTEILIPVCPEQLGGLPTPREPAELRAEKVITSSGKDITNSCFDGANEVLKLVKLLGIKEAILKQRSPSCGSGQVKMLSGEIVRCDGILASLLKKNGITVISEERV
ncbi:MAG: DUF523 domain-containing protein [Nanoarchaeota archaeon]|nr:DUF523 domain-containing protein [Nanoarchaeota archaeon]MBU4301108.1 DUF523 domain-containing protein [Nanoarchaeota archaeon]MCG2724591.1 DUF523 domain-containing protein [archaeon]